MITICKFINYIYTFAQLHYPYNKINVKVYPVIMTEDEFLRKKYDKLIHKIVNISVLSRDDIVFIQTLPNTKLLDIIYKYDKISDCTSEFLQEMK